MCAKALSQEGLEHEAVRGVLTGPEPRGHPWAPSPELRGVGWAPGPELRGAPWALVLVWLPQGPPTANLHVCPPS